MERRNTWQKTHLKIQIARPTAWKRPDSPSSVSAKKKTKFPPYLKGDDGRSKFVLENLQYYTIHPNLKQYYEPHKLSDQRKILGNQKIKRFMSRVTEYDQNKTLLIMTNNPPPSPINWQGKDNPPRYFSQELLAKSQEPPKSSGSSSLPMMPQKKKTKSGTKLPFPLIILEDAKPKREQWYRFSTKADFKFEANFSKIHAQKKQQEEYPHLSFAPDFRSAKDLGARRKVSMVTWEPLTLATLLEEKPTLSVPLPAESPFRHGRAPQWFIPPPAVPN